MKKGNLQMKITTKKRRRLKKSIREKIMIVLVGTIGALIFTGMWIGSVIQTADRLAEMPAEVYPG